MIYKNTYSKKLRDSRKMNIGKIKFILIQSKAKHKIIIATNISSDPRN